MSVLNERITIPIDLELKWAKEILTEQNEHLAKLIAENSKLREDLREDLREEPVAWCQMVEGKVQDLLTSFEMKDWLYDKSWIPLYTTPPKREPLTPQQISEGNQSMFNVTREAFKQGVKFAEKMHGIGGGE